MQQRIVVRFSPAVRQGARNMIRRQMTSDEREIDNLCSTLGNYEATYRDEDNDDLPARRLQVYSEINHLRTILKSQEPPKTRKHTFARRFCWISRAVLEPPKYKKALRACYNGLVKLVSWFKPRFRSNFWKKSTSERLSNTLFEHIKPVFLKQRWTL